jgi:hypothetical protein
MLCRHIYIYISRTPPATIPITTWFSSVLAADAAAAVALPPPSKSQGLLHPQRRNPNVCVRRLYRKGVGWGRRGNRDERHSSGVPGGRWGAQRNAIIFFHEATQTHDINFNPTVWHTRIVVVVILFLLLWGT